MRPRVSARSALSVAVGIVRSVAGLLGHYVTDVPPLTSTALERARWTEMVESASRSLPRTMVESAHVTRPTGERAA